MASLFSRLARPALMLAISGSAVNAATAIQAPGSAASLDPIAFFTGRTRGAGELDTLLSSPVKLTVESIGRRQGDTLVLDQTIREGSKPPRVRRWIMKPVAPED